MSRGFVSSATFALAAAALLGCAAPPPPVATTPAPAPAADAGAAAEANRRLAELAGAPAPPAAVARPQEHRIGPDDLLQIKVFESEELSGQTRVSGQGEISLALVGVVRAAGLTPRELERSLQERLRGYILDPHVSVQIAEVQSHPISVLGAVREPGVFQVRGSRRLSEVLAMAGGLTPESGDRVLIVRSGPAAAGSGAAAEPAGVEVDLHALLESADPRHDVAVHPGDVVKVVPAGMVYLVGEVNKPGAFPLASSQGMTVLQAVAMGEGLKPGATRNHVLLIRTSASGERTTTRVDLRAVLAGRAADPPLEPKDVVYVPNNAARSFTLGAVDALVRMVTLRGVF